ncbi:rRNA maturation RNase YbeY [Idiomarina sp. ST20R2A10]|uniref:rRNA maturation RNase YbeY n=1 Tax=unclassified Idiomarina TaxID=2614829 RepID=UPI00030BD08A|nr:rRNA maturation RNase YbeY [Idiomarina sp. 28-8]NWO02482.1 rRNA maturation RNase YbeY [Idiomarinaceae bacterium]
MADLTLDYQLADGITNAPEENAVHNWVSATLDYLKKDDKAVELTVRIAASEEAQQLNNEFRNKDYATNVLSFPFNSPVELPVTLLGDLVICQSVVEREAEEQQKSAIDHWTHMVIHGTLHLLGYDHIEDDEAEEMEQIERNILASLGISDPYQTADNMELNTQ